MAKLEEARETARRNFEENEITLENGVKLSESKEEVKAEPEKETKEAEVKKDEKVEEKEPAAVEEPKEEENKEEVPEPKIDIPEIPLTPDVPVAPVEPITAPVITPSVPEMNTPNNDFVVPSIGQQTSENNQVSSVSDSAFNFASNIDIPKSVSKSLNSPDDVNEFLTGYYDMKKRHEEEENNYIKEFTDKVTDVIHDRNNLKGGQQKLINILSGGESSMGPSFSQDNNDAFRR